MTHCTHETIANPREKARQRYISICNRIKAVHFRHAVEVESTRLSFYSLQKPSAVCSSLTTISTGIPTSITSPRGEPPANCIPVKWDLIPSISFSRVHERDKQTDGRTDGPRCAAFRCLKPQISFCVLTNSHFARTDYTRYKSRCALIMEPGFK